MRHGSQVYAWAVIEVSCPALFQNSNDGRDSRCRAYRIILITGHLNPLSARLGVNEVHQIPRFTRVMYSTALYCKHKASLRHSQQDTSIYSQVPPTHVTRSGSLPGHRVGGGDDFPILILAAKRISSTCNSGDAPSLQGWRRVARHMMLER